MTPAKSTMLEHVGIAEHALPVRTLRVWRLLKEAEQKGDQDLVKRLRRAYRAVRRVELPTAKASVQQSLQQLFAITEGEA